MLDTIANVQNSLGHHSLENSFLDYFYKISMVIIASINLVFAIYFFSSKKKIDNKVYERNRRIDLFKSLVINYNMNHLYGFFDKIDSELDVLKQESLTIEEKIKLNNILIESGKILRQRFIDTLLAIDNKLYDDLISETDKLIDAITESIFDEGIKLSYLPMFDQKISKIKTESKTKIIRTLFSYKGD